MYEKKWFSAQWNTLAMKLPLVRQSELGLIFDLDRDKKRELGCDRAHRNRTRRHGTLHGTESKSISHFS